jgi:protein arginine phosphatase
MDADEAGAIVVRALTHFDGDVLTPLERCCDRLNPPSRPDCHVLCEWILQTETACDARAVDTRPIRFRALFVCSGNTCRSPMAQYLLPKLLLESELTVEEVEQVQIVSCGTAVAKDDVKAADLAVDVIRQEYGLDLTSFRPTPIEHVASRAFDVALCMERRHQARAEQVLLGAERIEVLGGRRGVADPFGGTREDYAETAADICEFLAPVVEQITGIFRREEQQT